MNRTVRCLALFAIGVGAWACKGDPQSSLDRGTIASVTADPAQIFVANGAITPVLVDARDNLNQAVEITSVTEAAGGGITVTRDFLFQPVFDAGATDQVSCDLLTESSWTGAGCLVPRTNPTRLRYEVLGTTPSVTSLSITINGSNTIDIPVTVTPASLSGTLSSTSPASGEDVTVTLPSELAFDPAVVSDPAMWQGVVAIGSDVAVVSDVQASVVTFQFGPNITGNITVNSVTIVAAPAVPPQSPSLTETFASPQLPPPYAVTLSPASPVTGFDVVTVTAGAGLIFDQTADMYVGPVGTTCPADPACILANVISRAVDGSSIDALFEQNRVGSVHVTGMASVAAPQFATLDGETDQAIDILATFVPVTVSRSVPSGIGLEVVRLTLSAAGFSFDPAAAVVSIDDGSGGSVAFMNVGVDPGGTWVEYVPVGGSTGTATVSGILFGGLQFQFPANNLAVVSASTLTGTDTDPGPVIALPGSGSSLVFYDDPTYLGTGLPAFGGFPGDFYHVAPAGATTFDYTLTWSPGFTADLGTYFTPPNGTSFVCVADGFGGQAGGPEVVPGCAVPGGSNTVMHMITFDVNPPIIRQQFDVQ